MHSSTKRAILNARKAGYKTPRISLDLNLTDEEILRIVREARKAERQEGCEPTPEQQLADHEAALLRKKLRREARRAMRDAQGMPTSPRRDEQIASVRGVYLDVMPEWEVESGKWKAESGTD